MGCDCCKIMTPDQYEMCQKLDEDCKKKRIRILAPCAMCNIGFITPNGGSNYTPPRRKSKKLKKKKR